MKRRHFGKTCALAALAVSASGYTSEEDDRKNASFRPSTGRVIDAHMHLRPYRDNKPVFDQAAIERCLAVESANFVRYAVNIGITGDDIFFPLQKAMAPYRNRIGTMYAFDWTLIQSDAAFFDKAPDMLEKAVEAGALGLKCFKDLGLTVRDRDGSLLKLDDPRLDAVWECAGKLDAVVAIHATDPVAFFAPWNAENERWDELELHPNWSFADRSKYPPREDILIQRDNAIKRHPDVTFMCCHVANNSEDIDALDRRFEEMPNLYADISARLGELGRHPADKGHAFFTKYSDRLLFGTDHYFALNGEVQGAGPMDKFSDESNKIFYGKHWRYFQTRDRQFDHPTPIQGNWKIDGIGLDENILEKLYWKNAVRLFRLDRFGIV